jgi:hypothetical protein
MVYKLIMNYRDKSFQQHSAILFTFSFSIQTREQNRSEARTEAQNILAIQQLIIHEFHAE